MFIPFEEGEVVIAKVHRHWWFIFTRVIGLCFIAVLPFIAYVALGLFNLVRVAAHEGPVLVALLLMWASVLWGLFWQFWTTYYMDVWIVTNRRIIDIDYQRLFDRNISIIHLDRVQDVATRVEGLLPTLLKYGQVIVQSAGSERQFVIDQISNPEHLRNIISDLAGKVPPRHVI
jgi:hypothetical protein